MTGAIGQTRRSFLRRLVGAATTVALPAVTAFARAIDPTGWTIEEWVDYYTAEAERRWLAMSPKEQLLATINTTRTMLRVLTSPLTGDDTP